MERVPVTAREKYQQDMDQLRTRNAELEAEVERLNKMRVHCENCGADYMATGIEAGCPCKLTAEVARLWKAALAYRDLCACYRVGKRPSEKLFTEITLAKATLEAVSDGKSR